jgi:hypothetical protein
VSSVKASRAVGVAKTPQPISPGTTDYGYDLPGRLTEVILWHGLQEAVWPAARLP